MTTITLPRAVVEQALKEMEKATEVMEVHFDDYFEAMNVLRAALAQEPHRDLRVALQAPGCERLREWVEIGPVQRAALQTFVAALAQEQAESERHFCKRCGKRLSLDGIHTCTPPQQANPPGCEHCNHPLYAATKCRVCGRVTEQAEPVQEPGTPATVANLARDIHAAVLRRRESGHEPVRRTMTPKELIAGINGSEKWQVIERALKTDGEKE